MSPIFQFDTSGKRLKNIGAGMFVSPHKLTVDDAGNLWLADNGSHQVFKMTSDAKVLLTLGKKGVAGPGTDEFDAPTEVAVAPNGDIFVADGHVAMSNSRIVKFSKDGKFIKAWGKLGSAPGDMNVPHSLAMDSRGRLFVADRSNSRIQIFDQDGKFLDQWKQFGRPSGIYIDRNDHMVVADSQSNSKQNPGYRRGIYVGSARDGKVAAVIPFVEPDPDKNNNAGVEGVAIDAKGNVYGAEVSTERLKKYLKGQS